MNLKISTLRRMIAVILLLCCITHHAFAADCELLIKRTLDTGTPDQIGSMGQASKRIEGVVQAGLADEKKIIGDISDLGKDMLDVIDANVGGNDKVTIHDLWQLLNNPKIPDEKISTLLNKLNRLRKNNALLPGILTKPGPAGDGSSRLILNIKSAPNLGVVFEPSGAIYVIETLGETPIGMGGRSFFTTVDGTKTFLFEGDLVTASPSAAGKAKLWDFKNINGDSSLTVEKVRAARDAILNSATVDIGGNTFVVGEAAFGIEAGGSVGTDVLAEIDSANAILQGQGLPPIRVVTGIPF